MSRNADERYATRALERARRRKRRGPEQARPTAPTSLTRATGLFEESLVVTFPHKKEGGWTVPVTFGLHAAALLALLLVPILVPIERAAPPAVFTFLNYAAPPPPPPLAGSPLLPTPDRDEVSKPQPKTPDPEKTFKLPDEILKPKTEVQYGSETGVDIGDIQGMEGGVPGGVVGGVLGGKIGGVIGGTGTDVPEPSPDVAPRPLKMTRPSYTVEAIRKKVSGEVVLQALIDVRGRVRVIKILRSIPELDRQAIETVERDWLFRPATKNDRPVATLAVLTVTFNLY